jgi:hypothetical protein
MNDDYLWDKSGPPDPEIERLEATLASLRYQSRGTLPFRNPRPPLWWAAVAAAIVAALITPWLIFHRPPQRKSQPTSWHIASAAGAARIDSQDAAVSMKVRTGQLLRTGRASQVTLQADDLGRIDIGPNSEIRAAAPSQMLLQLGVLHAYIWAPPRRFVVDTPSSRAVDLGCEYTLNVDASGNGLLKVAMGWVAFQYQDQEAFIPAGGWCVTSKRKGPGIPFYEDAPEALRAGLAGFERGDLHSLAGILKAARPRDGITVWHLLTRVPAQDRGAVFDRFAQLETLPPEVTREGIMRRDPHMIDLCWDALDLEATGWWRGWERRWN